ASTFILVPKEKVDTNKKVTAFFDYAYKNGDAAANKLGYIPLPQSVKDQIRAYWEEKGISPAK
ncbi:MAG TPA: phosphate ABC transporter substrate-binding protein PstS, partial [Nautiliaceae bacterium]|nr:phosphate ABC transporter substrate-binding protein PstS [Nautiliaceae bacterium]